jgi:short-subunit dehydrogenase
MASDLSIRYRVQVLPIAADVAEGDDYLDRVCTAVESLGGIDGLLFPAGAVLPDDGVTISTQSATRLVQVNFLSVVATVTRLMPVLLTRRKPVIVGFGSVAAARGRGKNAIYSASKRALGSYFESLRHALAGSVDVQLYVLGYMDTTLGMAAPRWLPRADPMLLSQRVLRNLHREIGVEFYPSYWGVLVALVRAIPWTMYRHMRF